MALTHEQIWAVADDLQAKGVKPTLDAVRNALGRRGSFTTLCDAMALRREQLFTQRHDAKEPLPAALTQQMERLGQQIWASATAYANDRLNSDREQFDRMAADLKEQRTEAAQVANEATDDLAKAQLRIEVLETEVKTLTGQIDQARATLSSIAERLAASAARGDEADRRIGDLNRELQRVSDANASLIRAIGAQWVDTHKGSAEEPAKAFQADS